MNSGLVLLWNEYESYRIAEGDANQGYPIDLMGISFFCRRCGASEKGPNPSRLNAILSDSSLKRRDRRSPGRVRPFKPLLKNGFSVS
jgi:hypothetical protein